MSSELPKEGMENIQEEVSSAIKATINSVHEIWVEIYGIEDSFNPARFDDLKTKILNFCDALQDQAENQKNALIKRVEAVLKEIIELEQVLGMDGVKDYKNTDIPLVEMDCQVWSILSKYRAEKEQRMEKLKTLQTKEETLCKFLDLPVPHHSFQNGSIPTPPELEEIEDGVYKLEEQERDLMEEFFKVREAVAKLIKELDLCPVLKCELAACKESDALFPPSKKNLEEMKTTQQNLMTKLQNIKFEADELRDKLKAMWSRCKWDPSDLNTILSRHSGHSKVDIAQLKSELKVCLEERRTRVKEFILDLRKEIFYYWDKCCYSEEKRKLFKTFYTNDFNEDVLEIHELEVENLKNFYEKHKIIYKLSEKRREFWDRLKSIEETMKDPNRLFTNRGGQLLQEEKERKTIQKELPKIEGELKEYLSQFEKENGSPFRIYGHDVRDLIKLEWDEWHASKDSQKKARKVANAHTIEVESKLGARTMMGTKRKLPATPNNHHNVSNKIPKLSGPSNHTLYHNTTRHQKLVQTGRVPREKLVTPGRLEVAPRVIRETPTPATSTPAVSFIQSSPNLASYISFEQHLEKTHSDKEGPCRSSVKQTSERVLRARNVPNVIVRTPNKPTRIITPYKMQTKTPSKSPFKIATGSRIPTYVEPMKSPKTLSSKFDTSKRQITDYNIKCCYVFNVVQHLRIIIPHSGKGIYIFG